MKTCQLQIPLDKLDKKTLKKLKAYAESHNTTIEKVVERVIRKAFVA